MVYVVDTHRAEIMAEMYTEIEITPDVHRPFLCTSKVFVFPTGGSSLIFSTQLGETLFLNNLMLGTVLNCADLSLQF